MPAIVKKILQFLIFASIGGAILYLLYQSQSTKYVEDCMLQGNDAGNCSLLQKLIDDFKSCNWFWLFVILFIYMFSCVFRAWRWQMLFVPLGHKASFMNAFMAIMIGYFANLGLPRLGEALRAGLFAKYDQAPVEKVFGTIVTDRIVDILSLFVFLIVTAPFAYGPIVTYLRQNQSLDSFFTDLNWTGVLIGGLLILGLVFILLRASFIRQSAIYKKLLAILTGFKEGVFSIFKLKRPGIFILHTIGIWVCYYFMTYLTFYAYEPTAHLGPKDGLITFIFGTLGILFPSPGGMGSYHFMIMEALSIFNIDSIESFSFANIIYFAIMVFGNVVFGILSLIAMPILNQNVKA